MNVESCPVPCQHLPLPQAPPTSHALEDHKVYISVAAACPVPVFGGSYGYVQHVCLPPDSGGRSVNTNQVLGV